MTGRKGEIQIYNLLASAVAVEREAIAKSPDRITDLRNLVQQIEAQNG